MPEPTIVMSYRREKFFLVVPIGLERASHQELLEWSMVFATEFSEAAFLRNVEVVKGGIEFEVSEEVGLLLNRCLKIPSRILQRVHSFTTREWVTVEKELRTIPWDQFFPQGIQDWEIAASESKMNNEKHLAQFLEEKFSGRFYASSDKGTKAYLRVHNNVFTISRDTSGEHLHFRGYRKQQGEAPLRENLAAFLWSLLIDGQSRCEVEQVLIVDPFVGAGTLLIEAQLWNSPVATRDFASKAWISEKAEKRFKRMVSRLNPWNLKLIGVDRDPSVLRKAQENFQIAKFRNGIALHTEDSCSPDTPTWLVEDSQVWLMSNPPYGGKGRLKGVTSWHDLWAAALKRYNPEKAVAVGPEREVRVGMTLHRSICVGVFPFLNGGIRVAASLWKNR